MRSAEGFEFREATPADAPAMARCWSADRGNGPADPRIAAYFEQRHHPQEALPPRAGFLALHNGDVIGYIAGHLTKRHGCEGEVQYLFVAPEFRRLGVGTALLERLAKWFQAHSAGKICVAVAADSPPGARPFVESAGATLLKKNWYALRLSLKDHAFDPDLA